MKKLIASADRNAMTGLLQSHLAKRTAGVLDKDSEFATSQVIDDHQEYAATLEGILREDKTESFPPNDVLKD